MYADLTPEKLDNEIVIIGGGLGGLTAAFLLANAGRKVLVIEKKAYPFHRVCGEYVSNEVKGFLIREGLFPHHIPHADIHRFRLSATDGRQMEIPLDLGGFGISRFALDHHFYRKCVKAGVDFLQKTQALDVHFDVRKQEFSVDLDSGERLQSLFVLGAFGKRSKIDRAMNRPFIGQRSPYIGVKYHVRTDHATDTVALHNFRGGYFGINQIEDGMANLCYLGSSRQLRECGSIRKMEEKHLFTNPRIRSIYEHSEFLWDKPEVINEISFAIKKPVENGVLMLGDAAGMISPLCGNGMAIAIHTGKLAAEAVLQNHSVEKIGRAYAQAWRTSFQGRIAIGRKVQALFGSPVLSRIMVDMANLLPFLAKKIMKHTHGQQV
ncbi:NAD(P)/FAD-dependent oxidoreductase [Negadavirga shengliensis]|uniref:NAD(P)/FAD-dependent oxidoreductase n=1 Tax=Negadavirga shengliensis TaxID=1389218 RepID=A0ABV9SWA8_9BACT